MENKELITKLESAQADLKKAEVREVEARNEYNDLLADKFNVEMGMGHFPASKERRLNVLRSEFSEASKVAKACREHVQELQGMLKRSEIDAARAEQNKFVRDAINVSAEIEVHLRALNDITAQIHQISIAEYDHVRAANRQLDLFGTKFELREKLRFGCGALLPPAFTLEGWLDSFKKHGKTLAD